MKNKNSLWVEKYRPDSLDGYVCSDDIKSKFRNYIDTNDIPHLMFAGNVGIGKTTAAMLLLNHLECDKLIINASDARGINIVRERVSNFAQTMGFKKLKIVLLEEADKLTGDAQDALKFITEQYSTQTRFIITCNTPDLIVPALKSRFVPIDLVPPSLPDVAKHLINILEKEGIKYEKTDLANLVKEHYPDLRFMVKILQDDSYTGEFKPSGVKSSQRWVDEIIEILKAKKNKSNDFTKIRQIVADSGAFNFLQLYKKLYKEVDNFAPGKQGSVMMIVADMLYKDNFVADKEINAMSTIVQIISEIYG